MSLRRLIIPGLVLAMVLPSAAFAHHGKDFLLVESFELPEPGETYLVLAPSYLKRDSGSEIALEPSILVGMKERLAIEAHVHASREQGENFRYEAVAPAVHWEISDPWSFTAWKGGVSAEAEIAKDGPDRYEVRFVESRHFDRSMFVANLIAAHGGGDPHAVVPGYAAGWRLRIDRSLAFGIEATGMRGERATDEALAAVYSEPIEGVTVKLGVGHIFGDDPSSLVIRSGVVLHF
ncbi:MAG: hypothetical protein WBX15_07745 [Thermoanaerobaculia bacterium]